MRQARLITLLIAVSAFLAAQTDPPGRVGRLNYTNGPVSFQPASVSDWVDADVNRPLTTGDQVWVGDGGRAEILQQPEQRDRAAPPAQPNRPQTQDSQQQPRQQMKPISRERWCSGARAESLGEGS
jgi:hypothetical protein